MKIFFFSILFLVILSCDKEAQEEPFPLNASPIIGNWQLVSESYSIGGPPISVAIENGGVYNFLLDGTFGFSTNQEVSKAFTGTYTFENEILTLSYKFDDKEIVRKLDTMLEGNSMELWPAGPTICIEGCSFTLLRVD